ncbi:hypothetical protein DL98DRAFT_510359 [Cadophora sp. DSE1049]|nr:hypothetical protein DL98DRAFT_510359 [Cadophora sp. DSE1049]
MGGGTDLYKVVLWYKKPEDGGMGGTIGQMGCIVYFGLLYALGWMHSVGVVILSDYMGILCSAFV